MDSTVHTFLLYKFRSNDNTNGKRNTTVARFQVFMEGEGLLKLPPASEFCHPKYE
jgi:hypothetical protein